MKGNIYRDLYIGELSSELEGKEIRIANNSEELEKNYNIVKQEAKISFNDERKMAI